MEYTYFKCYNFYVRETLCLSFFTRHEVCHTYIMLCRICHSCLRLRLSNYQWNTLISNDRPYIQWDQLRGIYYMYKSYTRRKSGRKFLPLLKNK